MVKIKDIIWSKTFEKEFRKLKDLSLKERLKKQIIKVVENPEIGKPLKYNLRGERTIYVKPYRLIYAFKNSKLYLLKFEHRKKVY